MGATSDLFGFAGRRRGKNSHYIVAVAAFSPFFMQSPSFLAQQRHLADGHDHGRSNCQALFGMTAIPSDNHVGDMPPAHGAFGAGQARPSAIHPPLWLAMRRALARRRRPGSEPGVTAVCDLQEV
jgi:hypothetical protein